MYAKLFSRITESSLMEEEIDVRYTFVLMLAIADPKGYVVGTDVAISRRLNMKVPHFKKCIERLMEPDPDSNSQEEEGRRVVLSDIGRGYRLVNYLIYREMRNEEQRRNYMKEYMKGYRQRRGRKQVNLTLTQAEGEEEPDAHTEREAKASGNGKEKVEGASRDTPIFVPKHSYPKSEDDMKRILQHFNIQPMVGCDGNFFAQMEASGWIVDGQPVFDWPELYRHRLKAITPSEPAPDWGEDGF